MLNRLIRCLADIKDARAGFDQLPASFWEEEICGSLVYFDWRALEFVPEEYKTSKMIDIAIEQSGGALQWVPTHLRSELICWRAISRDPYAIRFVPESSATESMYAAWVERQGPEQPFLGTIPIRFRSAAICAAAVLKNPNNIFEVPAEQITPEVIDAFMESEIGEIWIEDIPEDKLTLALCEAMLRRGDLGGPDTVPEVFRAKLPPELLLPSD